VDGLLSYGQGVGVNPMDFAGLVGRYSVMLSLFSSVSSCCKWFNFKDFHVFFFLDGQPADDSIVAKDLSHYVSFYMEEGEDGLVSKEALTRLEKGESLYPETSSVAPVWDDLAGKIMHLVEFLVIRLQI
jgi:hypothetical protein